MTFEHPFVRRHLAIALALTLVAALFSDAYFHVDEFFQVLQLARFKLGLVESTGLPWEHTERMRPWLQPAVYTLLGKAFGVRDVFALARVARLATGLVSWATMAALLRVSLPWLATDEERRFHVRVTTLLGFLPYLFVRTSSETATMCACTGAVAVLAAGCAPREGTPGASSLAWRGTSTRAVAVGVLLGLGFETRYQSAFLGLSLVAWMAIVARAPVRALLATIGGGLAVVVASVAVDAWGYGEVVFPFVTYAQANLFEGAAALFGSDPPFAYLWMLPANVMAPVVIVVLVLSVIAWVRAPRHLLTWATAPFFVVHNLLSHKEERFLFPLALLATTLVTVALAPSAARSLRVASWLWTRRAGLAGKSLVVVNLALMAFLCVYPIGWHQHVAFTHEMTRRFGDDVHLVALPDYELGLPAFHPRVWEVEKVTPEELDARTKAGTAEPYLVSDDPWLASTPGTRLRLEWTELPLSSFTLRSEGVRAFVQGYNARARKPLRPLRFRSLYRVERAEPSG